MGAGVRAAGVPRDDVIVPSKLPGRHHAYDEALAAVEESLYRTGLDRLGLYLVHWPNPIQNRYVEAWEALVAARERGLVREIGVCNFLPEHLDRLQRETGVRTVRRTLPNFRKWAGIRQFGSVRRGQRGASSVSNGAGTAGCRRCGPYRRTDARSEG
ncbi:aldo/keto reductase [Propionicicella superfundia]|uniref:aldo/keto reductase n=1 Tax=Propionicicella superfundia TaxID=348582 RepID=UPI001FE1DE0D|nr:aldo/keto reductase [Propionicicella superfundia]